MCSDNTLKTTSTAFWMTAVATYVNSSTACQWHGVTTQGQLNSFWKRAVKICGKLDGLLLETAVATYGNPTTAY